MQQVNFFQDQFKRIDIPFSGTIFVIVLGYCLVISILISATLLGMSQWELGNDVNSRQQLSTLMSELDATKKTHPEPIIDNRLISKIDILKAREQKNKRLLKYLASQSVDINQQSFSGMLNALSEINQQNLWLTKVRLFKGGNEIELTGRTLSAAALPEYLDKLSKLMAFSEMEFDVFDIKRTKSGLQFVVSSKREENELQSILDRVSKDL